MQRMRNPLSNERGQTLAMLGISLSSFAFVALVVVAVDIGRLAHTATEVQSVAEVAATAGATKLVTSNGDVTAAKADAQSVVSQNTVDGASASIAPEDILTGNYNQTTHTFTLGGTPANAMQATARATVQNLTAAMLGSPSTTVVKTAVAGFTTSGSEQPGLPLALCRSDFSSGLPLNLVVNPTGNQTSAWTGFFGDSGASSVLSYFPSPCDNKKYQPAPTLNVGKKISVTNGTDATVFDAVNCMFQNVGTTFVVAVIDCSGGFSAPVPVAGFATIVIKSVGKKQITLDSAVNATAPGTPGGCPECGTGFVILVG